MSNLIMNVRWDKQKLKPANGLRTLVAYYYRRTKGNLFGISVLGVMRTESVYGTAEEAKEAIELELGIRSGPTG